MDAGSEGRQLTVAEAVQAATQAQQVASPPVQPPAIQSSAIDNLTCQWQGCGERCDTAETLYDHVCERHVGRKSTNNLNLTCQWGACRTTTVKRDHITSHIRVHVPLKPHKCDFCGKAFKRPQDLKKHVKTHADDSVLLNSPSQGANDRSGSLQNSKPYFGSHNDSPLNNAYSSYQPSMTSANGGYPQTANGQYGSYGSVSYPNSAAAMQDLQSMDTRRRAIEALNDFLGDIKRRAIDPGSYYDVGHRLSGNALPLPIGGSGYNTGYNNQSGTNTTGGYNNYNTASLLDSFTNGGGMGGGSGFNVPGGAVASHGYSLPLPNARTKGDLQDIDRFLEQLQATVYETSSHSAAAGIQQPGVHATYTGDYGFTNNHSQYRSSNSPTNFDHGSMSGVSSMSGVANNAGLPHSASALDTPALTPASISSYNSAGQSPTSSHGRSSLSSNAMYPSLPSVTGMSDLGYSSTSAPSSSLSSGFEGLDGRRYSGGRLQRQAPIKEEDTEMVDADDGSRTPRASDAKGKAKADSSIDPALRGEESEAGTPGVSSPHESAEDNNQAQWVENMRVIEALRKYVSERLSRGEFEEQSATPVADAKAPSPDQTERSIDIAKMVEEKLASANREHEEREREQQQDQDVKYPSLPTV